jgi:hypothetical protein
MKKTLLILFFIFGFYQTNHAQAVGLLGTALSGYTANDINLTQISQYEFVLLNQTFTVGTVKFRKDDSWTINWGSSDFPNGIGVQDGAEIPVPAGTYDIYFKINTGLYSFTAHDNIGIIGTAVSANGFTGDDINLSTTDNIHFSVYYPFTTGAMKIRKDDSWTTNWGSSSFPSGFGVQDGANIPVPAGNYLFTFNRQTGEYNFSGTPTYPNISIIGTAIPNGNFFGPDVDMTTTDGITYTLNNYTFTNGELKFRQDHSWTTNWGGTNFPMGTGILNSTNNLPIPAGTYTVTFNIQNGTYSFVGTPFPKIGIWGPAVNSQLGYTAPDVKMNTVDGINYTLSDFYFSSGNGYFRQDDNPTLVWGSTTFPTGTAVSNGPSLFIPGGEYYVYFNRNTGDYSFSYPIVSVVGTAVAGWDTDLIMNTTDGENYYLAYSFNIGECKFRKNNSWNTNWGGTAFPVGTATALSSSNIPVSSTGFDYVTFNRYTLNYSFSSSLNNDVFSTNSITVFPNPTNSNWNFNSKEIIEKIEITDVLGKHILEIIPHSENVIIDSSKFNSGIYFAKISSLNSNQTIKLIKN